MDAILPYDDAAHRSDVITLWNLVFDNPTAHRLPSRSIDLKLAVNDGLFFVAVVAGVAVGTVMAGYDGHRGWLYSVAVHPDHRRQGIGEALVRHAEAALRALGCLKINLQVVESNAQVLEFYKALGFHVETHISMGKALYQSFG